MAAPPIQVGDRIAGKYTVEAVIGEGGMGLVVAARHEELDLRVAIKLLLPAIAEQGTAAERFRREARSAARIKSEFVCRVLDVGTLESGVPYLVMEYLEGGDLAAELDKRERLPLSEAVDYLLQACEGLAEAHAAGIVHRDLKPANLYLALRPDGSRRVKVLDFGVSKALDDSGAGQHKLTQTATLIGSPLYMSPEQLSAVRDLDTRSDIWALGIVLYELVAGRTPFNGGNIAQLVHSVIHEAPPPLEPTDPALPRGIDAVITRALAKNRDERYASVAEFTADLAPFAPKHALLSVSRVSRLLSPSMRSRPPGGTDQTAVDGRLLPEPEPRTSTAQSTPMAWSGADKTSAGRSRSLWIAALAVLLLGGAALWASLRSAETASTEPEPYIATPAAAGMAPIGLPEAHARQPQPAGTHDTPEAAHAEPAAEPEAPDPTAEAAPSEVIEPGAVADAPSGLAPDAPAVPTPHATSPAAAARRESRKARKPVEVNEANEATQAPAAQQPAHTPTPSPAAPKPAGLSDFGGRR